MVARSKLKVALAAEKGLTDKKIKQMKDKKKHKAVIKDKRKKGLLPEEDEESEEDEDWEEEDDEEDDEEDSEAENGLLDMEAEESEGDESEDEEIGGTTSAAALMNESDTDSESEVEMEAKIQRTPKPKSILKKASAAEKKAEAKKAKKDKKEDEEEDDEEEEDEEESDIALSDLEDMNDSDREDLYVKTRLSINNGPALLASLKRIALPRDGSVPFSTHQLVASSEPTASKIEDISDDLNRELQLYAQSLEAAKKARALLRAEGVPFSRPNDYFAEMVKDDGHMEKVKAKLVEDATNKKAAAEARKLRDLKKFGKQVQVAKLQERAKEKRQTLEKIKALKKKRSENGNELGTTEADLFDVGVDNELNKPGKRSRGGDDHHGGRNSKRAKKDAKYGFGGKKRHAKSGDAVSSGDLSGFNTRKMKGQQGGGGGKKKPFKTARLGKSKRVAKAGKR